MITPLPTQPSLIDLTHERLVAAIADGTLAPGERLTQEVVAAKLGVSRQPVSHALRILRREGLAIESGKRGLVVAPLDGARLRDLYQVRAALDGLAASLAALVVRAGKLSSQTRNEGLMLLRQGSELTPDAAISDLIAADVAFHSFVYRLSGNEAIAETVAGQWPHFMRSMGTVLADTDIRCLIWREHAEILDSILAGEPAAAEAAARRHTEGAGDRTARKLESMASVA